MSSNAAHDTHAPDLSAARPAVGIGVDSLHASTELAANYKTLRNQAAAGFWLAAVCIGLGVGVVLAGAVIILVDNQTRAGLLTSVAGVVVNVVGGVGAYLFRATSRQLDATSLRLNQEWRVLTSYQITPSISPGQRDEVLINLVYALAGVSPAPRPATGDAPDRVGVAPALLGYSEWRMRQGLLTHLFTGDSAQHAKRQLLDSVYTRFPEKRKLSRPTVDTVFLAYSESPETRCLVKLQRVRGSGRADGKGNELFYIAEASRPGDEASVFLWRHAGKIVVAQSTEGAAETWVDVGTPEVDCLVVAHYTKGIPRDGDWLWVDVPKYTADHANISVAVLSDEPIADRDGGSSTLWEVHPFNLADVPAAFVERAAAAVTNGRQHLTAEMTDLAGPGGWLTDLQKLADGSTDGTAHAHAPDMLRRIRDALIASRGPTPVDFTTLFTPALFPHLAYFPRQAVQTPVIATFQRQRG